MEGRGTALIPRDKILDVQTQNKALLMKDPHNFFNSYDLPWVDLIWSSYYTSTPPRVRPVRSFWWKSVLKLISDF